MSASTAPLSTIEIWGEKRAIIPGGIERFLEISPRASLGEIVVWFLPEQVTDFICRHGEFATLVSVIVGQVVAGFEVSESETSDA